MCHDVRARGATALPNLYYTPIRHAEPLGPFGIEISSYTLCDTNAQFVLEMVSINLICSEVVSCGRGECGAICVSMCCCCDGGFPVAGSRSDESCTSYTSNSSSSSSTSLFGYWVVVVMRCSGCNFICLDDGNSVHRHTRIRCKCSRNFCILKCRFYDAKLLASCTRWDASAIEIFANRAQTPQHQTKS